MDIPKGTTIAVADGEKLNLFRNAGDEANPSLEALQDEEVANDNRGSGVRHISTAANPDARQLEEDGFAAGVAEMLNAHVLQGGISGLIVVAAPRTLGELRRHYHQKLSAILIGEIAKDLTGHSTRDVEKAIAAA